MNRAHRELVKKYDGFSFFDNMVRKGIILHKTFSIHNTLPALKEIVDANDREVAQIQLSNLDEAQQVGAEDRRLSLAT